MEGTEVMVTASVCGALLPHTLLAETEIFPFVELEITEIELVEDDPDHPEGNVQEYDVAPATEETL